MLKTINKGIIIGYIIYLLYWIANFEEVYPVFVLLAFSILIYFVIKYFKLDEYELFFVLLMCIAGIVGERFTFGWYYTHNNYDKYLHFINPMIIYLIVIRKVQIKQYKNFYVLSIVMGFVAMFEIVEYLFDMLLHSDMQGVFDMTNKIIVQRGADTMTDLLFDFLGAFTGMIYTLFISKRKSDSFFFENHKQ